MQDDPIRIPLHACDGSVRAYTLIDQADMAQAEYRWCWTRGYAIRWTPRPGRVMLYLHRVILGLEVGDPRQADHINRDRLDNRRSNLRCVTHAQNHQNMPSVVGSTSQYRGVSWDPVNQKWAAKAILNGQKHWLGRFTSEQDAAAAVSTWRSAHMPYAIEEVIA